MADSEGPTSSGEEMLEKLFGMVEFERTILEAAEPILGLMTDDGVELFRTLEKATSDWFESRKDRLTANHPIVAICAIDLMLDAVQGFARVAGLPQGIIATAGRELRRLILNKMRSEAKEGIGAAPKAD